MRPLAVHVFDVVVLQYGFSVAVVVSLFQILRKGGITGGMSPVKNFLSNYIKKLYKLEKVFILLLTEIHEKLRILVRVLLWEDLSDQLGRILYEDFDQLVPAGFVSEHPLRE